MSTRRAFLGLAAGAYALAAFRDDALERVVAAGRAAEGTSPEALAADERYWREIQQAFTVNRSYVNLNNGGVCPSPRVVQEAMKRYLDLSNEAPVYTMWQLLEPQVESVRRSLAREFGCDPEEMAITRNASEGLETVQLGPRPRAGRRGAHHHARLPPHAHHLAAARAAGRDRAEDDLLPVPAAEPRRPRRAVRAGGHAADEGHPRLPHDEPDRAGLPGEADLPDGARARDRDDRGRGARLRPLPLQARGPRLRLLRDEPAQVALRPARHRLPVRPPLEDRQGLAADGGGEEAGRGHPQVRGDRHPPRGQPQRDRGGARLPPTASGPSARRSACGTCATAG